MSERHRNEGMPARTSPTLTTSVSDAVRAGQFMRNGLLKQEFHGRGRKQHYWNAISYKQAQRKATYPTFWVTQKQLGWIRTTSPPFYTEICSSTTDEVQQRCYSKGKPEVQIMKNISSSPPSEWIEVPTPLQLDHSCSSANNCFEMWILMVNYYLCNYSMRNYWSV